MEVGSDIVISMQNNGRIQIRGHDERRIRISVGVCDSDEERTRRFLQLLSPFCPIQGSEPLAHWMQQAHLEERYVSQCISELPSAEEAFTGNM